jgi:hypothetical protein
MSEVFSIKEIDKSAFHVSSNIVIDENFADIYSWRICNHIPKDGKQCSHCENLLCTSCYQSYIQKDTRCPICRNQLNAKDIDPLVKRTLKDLIVRCPNDHCNVVATFETISQHYQDCEQTPREATCTACKQVIKTTNMLIEVIQHIQQCGLKEKCNYCKADILFKDIANHLNTCQKKDIICPHCRLSYTHNQGHNAQTCLQNVLIKYKQQEQRISELELSNKDLLSQVGNLQKVNIRNAKATEREPD